MNAEGEEGSSAVFKRCDDFLEGIPISICRRGAEVFLDLAEVADRLHFAAIKSEDKSSVDCNDFGDPAVFGRQTKRKRRRFAKGFVQDVDESSKVRPRWLTREWIFCRQLQKVACGTNHDL